MRWMHFTREAQMRTRTRNRMGAIVMRRPYGTPERIRGTAFPTLKRGANLLCAYGARRMAAVEWSIPARGDRLRLHGAFRRGGNGCRWTEHSGTGLLEGPPAKKPRAGREKLEGYFFLAAWYSRRM
jgi:hypothetical protein